MTTLDLEPIKERLAAATPGPWRVWTDPDPTKVRATAVDGLHRKTPVYDTFADDCEEHDPEEHAIEGLDSSVAGPSTVSSIDW